ncbi:MAG: STAS domain-containing protein [Gaiellaceae bacterium]
MGAPGSRATGTTDQRQPIEEFRIDEERLAPSTVVLAIYGEADMRIASELKDRLGEVIDDGPSAVVLDLSAATFVDSTALGVLLGAMKRQQSRSGRFRIVAPVSEIRRIFEMTLLDRVFELDLSRREALAAARDGQPRDGL